MNQRNIALTLVLSTVSALAGAQTLAEKEAWAREQQSLDKSVAATQAACGAKVALTVDRPSWWKVQDQWAKGSPAGRCGLVYEALTNVCGSADGKNAVAGKIKTVQCAYGGTNSGYKLELKDGTLNYQVQLDRPNQGEEIVKFLKTNI